MQDKYHITIFYQFTKTLSDGIAIPKNGYFRHLKSIFILKNKKKDFSPPQFVENIIQKKVKKSKKNTCKSI